MDREETLGGWSWGRRGRGRVWWPQLRSDQGGDRGGRGSLGISRGAVKWRFESKWRPRVLRRPMEPLWRLLRHFDGAASLVKWVTEASPYYHVNRNSESVVGLYTNQLILNHFPDRRNTSLILNHEICHASFPRNGESAFKCEPCHIKFVQLS